MTDIFSILREKYTEDVGWSFSLFEIVSFTIYLFFVFNALKGNDAPIWKKMLTSKVYNMLAGSGSIYLDARVVDYLIALILTIITIYFFKYLQGKFYFYLSSIKNMNSYVKKLHAKYAQIEFDNHAIKIYIAKEANQDKNKYMKQISVVNGFGLISLTGFIASFSSFYNFYVFDFVFILFCLFSFLICQWLAFTRYVAQVMPRLVLERFAKNEHVSFGDEFDDA